MLKPDCMEKETQHDPSWVFDVSSGNTVRLNEAPWCLDYKSFDMLPASQGSERGPRTATASISTSPP